MTEKWLLSENDLCQSVCSVSWLTLDTAKTAAYFEEGDPLLMET